MQRGGIVPAWLTAKEAAAHLRLSKSRFYQLVREGKIVAYHIAGQGDARFTQEELDALFIPAPRETTEESEEARS